MGRLLTQGAPPETGGRLLGPVLIDAAANGDLDVVRALIEGVADPTAANREGKSAIHWAAMRGRNEVIRYLAELGVDVSLPDGFGSWTPLHLAAAHAPREGVCETLVELGADINAPSRNGRTPLAVVSRRGFRAEAATRTLLTCGADPNSADAAGVTALMLSTHEPQPPVLRLLLEHGADPTASDHDRRTALHHAASPPPDVGWISC